MEVQGRIKKLFITAIFAILLLSGCSANEKKNFENGKALLDEGKYTEAVEAFDKAISAHGSKNIRGLEIEERREYMDMLSIIYTNLCNIDMDIDIEDAIEMYERAESLEDRSDLHINAGVSIVKYYEDMYDKNLETTYLDKAEDFLEKLLKETNRKNAKVLAVYAKHLAMREDYDRALEAVEEGIALLENKSLNEHDDEVLKSLMFSKASCYEYMSDYNTALECFNAYIEKYGEDEAVSHEVAFLKSRIR